MYKVFAGIVALVLVGCLSGENVSATNTAQIQKIIKKMEKGGDERNSQFRYDKDRKVWVPYTKHILVTKKKKFFGVPILNDTKKRLSGSN